MTDSRTPRMLRVVRRTMKPNSTGSFQLAASRRQEAEERVARGGDRDGDGEDVVDQQGGARDDPGTGPKQVAGDHVAAAAAGELLDDAAIGGRDQQHRKRHERGQRHGQVGVSLRVP